MKKVKLGTTIEAHEDEEEKEERKSDDPNAPKIFKSPMRRSSSSGEEYGKEV